VTPPGEGGRGSSGAGTPDSPGRTAEARVRAAIASGQAPAASDVTAVLDELARVREDAEERWRAVTLLAPAAKRQRMRAQSAARSRARLEAHLGVLEQLLGDAPLALVDAMRGWAAHARTLLDEIDPAL
jgi:hypothetical protein